MGSVPRTPAMRGCRMPQIGFRTAVKHDYALYATITSGSGRSASGIAMAVIGVQR